MSEHSRKKSLAFALALAAATGASGSSWALQPLTEFRAGARTRSFDNREAREVTVQRAHEARQASYKLAPSLTATAGYTRNEIEAAATFPGAAGEAPRRAVITPKDQLDATIVLSVPIVDVGSWQRIGASEAVRDASVARAEQTARDVEGQVVRGYFQIVAAEAVLDAAKRNVSAAEESLAVVKQRVDAGLAFEVDAKRSLAEVAAREQSVADAEYALATARRSLTTLTGVAPTPGSRLPEDDLHEEAALASWEGGVSSLPSVKAAALDARAADKTRAATVGVLLPTVTGTASERFTNAVGFGKSPAWALGIKLEWRIELASVPAYRSYESQAETSHIRAERTSQSAKDALFDAWQRVRAQLAKARAARVQLDATRGAVALEKERYKGGTSKLIDVILAERDKFIAEVSRIQADSDLAYARAALRLAAGRAPEG